MILAGRVILITGGAHRVGKAIVMALAAEGARVAFTVHTAQAEAAQTVAELQALGAQALAIPCDQSELTQIHSAVQGVVDHFGRLDGLVNSAAIMQEIPFLDVTPEQWDATSHVNTRAPFFFMQAAARVMLAQEGGAIINILDESATTPTRFYVHHSASKAALRMLTLSAALALAPKVRVNAVLPGPVLIPEDWEEARWERLAKNTPLKRVGTPEDVARAVIYLMKEDFITGQVLVVDGGRTLRS